MQPDNAYSNYLLASVYFKSGKVAPALTLCEKAIELNPDLSEPYVVLGKILAGINDFHQAVKLFERAIQLNPDYPDVYQEIVPGLIVLGRHEDALGYAKKLLSLEPSALNHVPISRVLIELGRMEEADLILMKH